MHESKRITCQYNRISLNNLFRETQSFTVNTAKPKADYAKPHLDASNMSIKHKIENLSLIKIPSKKGFEGQSWGGAGVMIITADKKTVDTYDHFQGPKLITKYAYEIGHLYQELRPIINEHHYFSSLSKLEFWGVLTEELANTVKAEPDISFESLRSQLITYSLEIIKSWDNIN